MSEAPSNVVLICVDQWRGDCLGIDGHPVVQTPYLDLLASGGVRFNHAYSATPSCIAARAALLTGLSQKNHGRVGYRDGVPWNYATTLGGEFSRHGYQTQAVGKMHVHPARSLMGFHHVDLHDGYMHFGRGRHQDLERVDDYLPWLRQRAGHDADYFYHGVDCNSYVTQPWTLDERLHPTNYVTTQSADFLRRRDTTKPFFLFMSYHRPHPPLDPPVWAFEQYAHREMPQPPVGDWAGMMEPFHNPHNPRQTPKRMDPHALQRARAGYYGHLSHIDHQINRFLEILKEYEPTGRTWVCFVSDHGDLLGDHHLFAKALPYEGAARVPLILSGPRDSGLKAGAAVDSVVELRDILPTLLDCAGLAAPQGIDGRSMLPLARGETTPWRDYLHGEHTNFLGAGHYITDGRHKYIWFSDPGREQLFDLSDDPQELRDLSGSADHRAVLERLRAHLIHELTGREEGFTDGEKLIPGRPVTPVLSHVP
jgi:arylsulfatase A-like enzyme